VSFGVLFVCTGNVCRSPVAERYLRSRLRPGAAVRASSAGLRALAGHPVEAFSAQALRELGGDDRGHAARGLDGEMVRAADLILGAAAEHRDAVLRLVPAALHRTFTVKEFVRLGAAVRPAAEPGAAPAVVAAVAGQRGRRDPAPAGWDDIADPIGQPLEVARAVARDGARAVDGLLRLLGAQR
jgi:protein-tyrosine phosphatase